MLTSSLVDYGLGLALGSKPDDSTEGKAGHTDHRRRRRLLGLIPGLAVLLRMIAVFTLACAFWVFFRADNMSDAWMIWRKIITEIHIVDGYRELLLEYRSRGPLIEIVHLVLAFLAIEWFNRHKPHPVDFRGGPGHCGGRPTRPWPGS